MKSGCCEDRSVNNFNAMSNTSPANLQGAHRFLPSTLLEQLARCHPGKAAESKENLSAAFVHLDVCGLHELAEELDSKEEDATLAAQRREQVVGVLESWYAHVADVVAAHGGAAAAEHCRRGEDARHVVPLRERRVAI